MSNMDRLVKAVIQKVIPKGNHGPFVVATVDGIEGSITFSLNKEVWSEDAWPEPGEFVLLGTFHRKRAGWRAMKARFLKPEDEQTATRKEHIMKKISALLERLKAKFFPDEDDQTWKEWVDFKNRDWRELISLVRNGEVRDSLKARALFIMLTPSISLCPFYWIDHDGVISRYGGYGGLLGLDIGLDSLSPSLVSYVADLVTEFYQALKEQGSEKLVRTMVSYNDLVINLLAVLPDERSQQVFKLFEINDLSVWWNMDEASGYSPLDSLFRQKHVPEKWKRMADLQMRKIIHHELAGITQPRAVHENALKCYASMIQLPLFGKQLLYSRKLFVDQIRFIVGETPENWTGSPLINNCHVTKIFNMIAAEGDKELLSCFCRFILAAREEFKVYDSQTLKAAELMFEVLKNDPEAAILQDAILSGKLSLKEQGKQNQETATVEQAIIQKMKRPVT